MTPITILVVDRERAMAQVLARSLAASPEFEVVASRNSILDATADVRVLRPDVIVLDERLAPSLRAVATDLRAPHAPVTLVVTSPRADVNRAYEALQAGAAAYVTKDADFDEMARAIRGAARGETWIAPALLTGVLHRMLDGDGAEDDRISRLTDRERQVLACMVGGLDRSRIARELVLSVNTVRTHTQNILAKLEVHSSLEAVSVALQTGYPGPERGSEPRRRPGRGSATGAPRTPAPAR